MNLLQSIKVSHVRQGMTRGERDHNPLDLLFKAAINIKNPSQKKKKVIYVFTCGIPQSKFNLYSIHFNLLYKTLKDGRDIFLIKKKVSIHAQMIY